jgi:hypothetical protein
MPPKSGAKHWVARAIKVFVFQCAALVRSKRSENQVFSEYDYPKRSGR